MPVSYSSGDAEWAGVYRRALEAYRFESDQRKKYVKVLRLDHWGWVYFKKYPRLGSGTPTFRGQKMMNNQQDTQKRSQRERLKWSVVSWESSEESISGKSLIGLHSVEWLRKMRIETGPLVWAIKVSLASLTRAVSVGWLGQKPNYSRFKEQ